MTLESADISQLSIADRFRSRVVDILLGKDALRKVDQAKWSAFSTCLRHSLNTLSFSKPFTAEDIEKLQRDARIAELEQILEEMKVNHRSTVDNNQPVTATDLPEVAELFELKLQKMGKNLTHIIIGENFSARRAFLAIAGVKNPTEEMLSRPSHLSNLDIFDDVRDSPVNLLIKVESVAESYLLKESNKDLIHAYLANREIIEFDTLMRCLIQHGRYRDSNRICVFFDSLKERHSDIKLIPEILRHAGSVRKPRFS